MDVKQAKRLFDDLQRERELAWEVGFAKNATAAGWMQPVRDLEAAAFARILLRKRKGRANEPTSAQPSSPLRRDDPRNVKMRKLNSMPDGELQEIAETGASSPAAVQN